MNSQASKQPSPVQTVNRKDVKKIAIEKKFAGTKRNTSVALNSILATSPEHKRMRSNPIQRNVDPNTLLKIQYNWMTHYNSALPISRLQEYISGTKNITNQTSCATTDDQVTVQVEIAGSGKVLSKEFTILKSELIKNLPRLLHKLLPIDREDCSPFSMTDDNIQLVKEYYPDWNPPPMKYDGKIRREYQVDKHRISLGQGGQCLTGEKNSASNKTKCGDILASGDTLVILPGFSSYTRVELYISDCMRPSEKQALNRHEITDNGIVYIQSGPMWIDEHRVGWIPISTRVFEEYISSTSKLQKPRNWDGTWAYEQEICGEICIREGFNPDILNEYVTIATSPNGISRVRQKSHFSDDSDDSDSDDDESDELDDKSTENNSDDESDDESIADNDNETTEKNDQVPTTTADVEDLKEMLTTNLIQCQRSIDYEKPHLSVQLRLYAVRRKHRDTPEETQKKFCVDIVRIGVRPPRQGYGTQFFLNLTKAAAGLGGRVFIEQCITRNSQFWGKKLLKKGLVKGYDSAQYGGDICKITGYASFLSTAPISEAEHPHMKHTSYFF